MINQKLLSSAIDLVKAAKLMDKVVDKNMPERIAKIIKFHSKGAAIAAISSGWIPGAGGAIAITISSGFIWTMYIRINEQINIPIAKNILKSLASGIATNLATYALGSLIISSTISIFPGIGSASAAVLIGSICYALTLASGYIYLKMLTKIFESGKNPMTYKERELKNVAKEVTKPNEIKDFINKAKKKYKKSK